MKLPQLESAIIPQPKIVDYLLSPTHSVGQGKAKFFGLFGFVSGQWEMLAEALLYHAKTHEVVKVETTPFGQRYVIEGPLETPDKRNPQVRVVWFIDSGEETPRFVTAYPLEESEMDDD